MFSGMGLCMATTSCWFELSICQFCGWSAHSPHTACLQFFCHAAHSPHTACLQVFCHTACLRFFCHTALPVTGKTAIAASFALLQGVLSKPAGPTNVIGLLA